MWELDHKEGWTPENWCFQIMVLEKKNLKSLDTLASLLDCKQIKPINPKGNQLWIFNGRTDAEAPILWPSDVKSQLIGKGPDAGKDWVQEEKGDIRGWEGWMASLTQWTWVCANSRRWWRTGKPGVLQESLECCRKAWRAAFHGVTKSQTRLSNWTTVKWEQGQKMKLLPLPE